MKQAPALSSLPTPPWPAADDFYEALLDAHEGLSMEESTALNARLVLLLAQQVHDFDVLVNCLAQAQQT